MTRVSLTIDEIRAMQSGTRCHVGADHRIHFSRVIDETERVQITATTYDADITVAALPDKFLLAATYYVLASYYAEINPERANYYMAKYRLQWAAVAGNRQPSYRQYLGYDL